MNGTRRWRILWKSIKIFHNDIFVSFVLIIVILLSIVEDPFQVECNQLRT
jgi:hypothetical protein